MPPSPELPSKPVERRDAAENRERILEAARKLFADHGVNEVSMHQIAQAAGIGQGTLYRRFAHKGELCNALIMDSAIRFGQEVLHMSGTCHGKSCAESSAESAPEVGASTEPTKPALVRLVDILDHFMLFNETNHPMIAAMCDASHGDRRHSIHNTPIYVQMRLLVRQLVTEAIANGELPELDVEYTAEVLLAPLAIDLYLFQRHELGFCMERIRQSLHTLVFTGLQRR
jgi:AcrR family transcriptional regulator